MLSGFAQRVLEARGFGTILSHVERGYDLSNSLTVEMFDRLISTADLPILAALVEAKTPGTRDLEVSKGSTAAIRLRPVALLPVAAVLGDIRSLNSREERFARLRKEIADRITVIDSALNNHSELFVALDAWSGLFESAELFRAVEFILESISRVPPLRLLGPSSTEIRKLSQSASLAVGDVLHRLKRLGLDSVEGGFDLEVFEKARELEFRLAVGQPVGAAEAPRTSFVEQILQLKSRLGGLQTLDTWFPWSQSALDHQPKTTDARTAGPLGARILEFIALGRLLLPETVFVRAPITLLGPKLAHVALSYGANDLGFAAAEREARECLGLRSWEEVRDLIEQGGRYHIVDDFLRDQSPLVVREISNA